MAGETVPCKRCGTDTYMTSDKRCTNCWEVESRLERYLKSADGKSFVEMMLREAYNPEDEAEKK